jgi:proteasome lid subunit RPN8/RPN11
VVQAVAAAGHTIVTGCAVGGDQQVIAACLAQGLASRLIIFAAFGSNGVGAWKGSAVAEVLAAAQAGASVQWWAGGGPGFALVPRLKQRSQAAVQFVAADTGTRGAVAFVGSTSSPGTWSTIRQAIGANIPSVVFQSPKLLQNLAQFPNGTWLPAGAGVWAAGWKWCPTNGLWYTRAEEVKEVKVQMETPVIPSFPSWRHEWRVADGFHAPVINSIEFPPTYALAQPQGGRLQETPATYSTSPADQEPDIAVLLRAAKRAWHFVHSFGPKPEWSCYTAVEKALADALAPYEMRLGPICTQSPEHMQAMAMEMREKRATYSTTEQAVLLGLTALMGIFLPRLFHAIEEYATIRAGGYYPATDRSPFYIMGKLEAEMKYLCMVVEEGSYKARCYTAPTLATLEAATTPLVRELTATYTVPPKAKAKWAQEYLLPEHPTAASFTFEEAPTDECRPRAYVRVFGGIAYVANLEQNPPGRVYKANLCDGAHDWVYVRGQDGDGRRYQKVVYIGQYHSWAGLCEGLEVKLYESDNELHVSISYVCKGPHDVVIDTHSGVVPLSRVMVTLAENWFSFMEKAEAGPVSNLAHGIFPTAAVAGHPEYRQVTFQHLVAEPQGGYQPDFSEFAPTTFLPVPEKDRKPLRAKVPLGENNGKRYSVPIYQSCLVKDKMMMVEEAYIHSPKEAAVIAYDYLRYEDQEQVLVIALNGRNRVIGCLPVYRGSMNTAMIHLAELFKAASILGAPAIILFHNHPGGDPTPSPEDIRLTEQVIKAGKLLDIEVLDHVIVADRDGQMSFYSLNEHGHTLFTHNAPFRTGAK